MNKSESIAQLSAALVAASGKLSNPPFDSTNPHFKNKYASLAGTRDHITPILAEHGLSVSQLVGSGERGPCVETMLIHSSGEWVSERLEMPASKQDAQGWGSAITYARRYALMAICGVVGDVDDDGNEASNAAVPKKGKAANQDTETGLGTISAQDKMKAKKIANELVDLWTNGQEFAAYERVYKSRLPNQLIMAISDELRDFPAVRNGIKDIAKEEREPNQPQSEAA